MPPPRCLSRSRSILFGQPPPAPAGGLFVYWPLRSSAAALVVLVLVVAAAEGALAVLERLRTARIRAAVEAGVRAERRP